MTTSIRVTASGWVYRNPKPHLRSIVAYHPSLTGLGGSELLATFDLGQAVEAFDYHTVAARSEDNGGAWSLESPLLSDPPPGTTHTIRTRRIRDGTVVGFGGLHRRIPEEGIANRGTLGLVRVELFIVRSRDGGRRWTNLEWIRPPLAAASWEVCHPVVELSGGRWLAPTSTWRGWNGEDPVGEQAVVLISDDRGVTWPAFGRSFDGRATGIHHWEQSVVELRDGRVLAVAWRYDADAGKTLPTVFTLSEDGGETFAEPRQTGFLAQTCKAIELDDGTLLCVYRRDDRSGLWATRARLEGTRWTNLDATPLWEGAESGMHGSASVADRLSDLKFGYPSLWQSASGEVLVVFWCREECVTGIRWVRIG